MFENNIKELYLFLTKQDLVNKYTCIRQKRKSTILYEFMDYKWVLTPENSKIIQEEDLSSFSNNSITNVLFIHKKDIKEYNRNVICRRLTENDKHLFKEFHDSCSKEDKEEGMVSLDDPVAYGCFVNDKIVSVSSLWNWGDKLSDVGILTHPEYRYKGYGRTVCLKLMSEINRLFVWRCDELNIGSHKLALSMGFIESGKIYELKNK